MTPLRPISSGRPVATRDHRPQAYLLLWWTYIFSVVIAFAGNLPDTFTGDSQKISELAQSGIVVGDPSFDRISMFYRVTRLAHLQPAAGFFGVSLFFILQLSVVMRLSRNLVTLRTITILCAAQILAGIYLGQFSKELVSVVVALCIVNTNYQAKLFRFTPFAACLLVGFFFRSYWLLLAAAYLTLAYLIVRTSKFFRIKALYIAIVFGGLLAFYDLASRVANGQPISAYRQSLNAGTRSVETTTLISPWFTSKGVLGSIAENALVLFSLLFPWPLATLGLLYLTVGCCVAWIWATSLKAMCTYLANDELDLRVVSGMAFVLAFVALQATFEPDYGSYLKHLFPFLPLLLLVVGTARPATKVKAIREPVDSR